MPTHLVHEEHNIAADGAAYIACATGLVTEGLNSDHGAAGVGEYVERDADVDANE